MLSLKGNMKVSVVIPTRNRLKDLTKLIDCLVSQTFQPFEVLIVDASDIPLTKHDLPVYAPIKLIQSIPSVCIQRNKGMDQALGTHILFCDDDLTFSENYLAELRAFLVNHPLEGAVTGLWQQLDANEEWQSFYLPNSFAHLCFTWLFGHSLWGPIDQLKPLAIFKPLYTLLLRFYKKKGNSISKAGWPINSQFGQGNFKVAVTSLGSALIKIDWLSDIRYDEVLDPHGYGDNYEVCLKLPSEKSINVIRDCRVLHHHSKANRATSLVATYRRVLALNYFLKTKSLNKHPRVFFYWSVLGHLLEAFLSFNFQRSAVFFKVLYKCILGRNPYEKGFKAGKTRIIP